MNHNEGKVAQYQRAVTPTLEGSIHSSGGSSVRGKVLNYAANGSAPVRNRMGGSLLSNVGAATPVGGLGNSYSLLRSGLPPTTNSAMVSPRNGPYGNNSGVDGMNMSITGKGSAPPAPLAYGNSFRGNTNSTNAASSSGGGSSSSSAGIANSSGLEAISPLSVLPRYDLEPISDEIPADGVIFARIRNSPDSLVVFRTPEERLRNPERLNLDRRQLLKCPILEQEQRLRLLNYQNNQIQVVENLENLPNLIFLDFYNNKLTSLSGPLPAVRGLRVLMAGKNKISTIANLQHLKKLDVLDLHSNDISCIENLEELHELRVLNLAGNRISLVSKLTSLVSLTELNLRRNQITSVTGLDQLPALQRIFLSHNQLVTFDDAACIFQVKHLIELSLDGNPLAEDSLSNAGDLSPNGTNNITEPHLRYRQQVILKIPTLKHLDLKRVTDEERSFANAQLPPAANASGSDTVKNETGGGLVDTTAGGDFDLSSLKNPSSASQSSNNKTNLSLLPISSQTQQNRNNEDEGDTAASASSGALSARSSRKEDAKSSADSNEQVNSSSGSAGNGIALLAKKGQLPKGMSHIDIEVLSSMAAYHQNPSIPGGKALVCVGDAWDWSHLLLAPTTTNNNSVIANGAAANTNPSSVINTISNGTAINANSVPTTVKRLLSPVSEIVLVHASRDISLHRLFSNSPAFLMQSFPQLQSISIVHCADIVRVADLDPLVLLFQQVESIRHMAITGDQTPLLSNNNHNNSSSSNSSSNNNNGGGQEDAIRSYIIAQIPRLIRFNDRDVTDSERQAAAQRWSPLLNLRKLASHQNQHSSSSSSNHNSSTNGSNNTSVMSPTAAGKRNSLGGLATAVGARVSSNYNNATLSPAATTTSKAGRHALASAANAASGAGGTRGGSVFVASSSGMNSNAENSKLSFANIVQQLHRKQSQLLQQAAATSSANSSNNNNNNSGNGNNGMMTARARPLTTTANTLAATAATFTNPSSNAASSAAFPPHLEAFLDRDAFNSDLDAEVRQTIVASLRVLQQHQMHLYGPPPTPAQINQAFFQSFSS